MTTLLALAFICSTGLAFYWLCWGRFMSNARRMRLEREGQ